MINNETQDLVIVKINQLNAMEITPDRLVLNPKLHDKLLEEIKTGYGDFLVGKEDQVFLYSGVKIHKGIDEKLSFFVQEGVMQNFGFNRVTVKDNKLINFDPLEEIAKVDNEIIKTLQKVYSEDK